MSALLPIILPERAFQSPHVFDPVTYAIETCIDEYRQSGVTDEKLPPLLAGLYHVEYYHGRVCGSGIRYYLEENAECVEFNLSYAKIGAETIGWKYGIDLIESVKNWCVQNTSALSTLTETKQHNEELEAFNSHLFQNDLSRDDAETLLAVLPGDIKDQLLQKFDADRYGSRSEFFIRSFVFLWTSELVKTVPNEEVSTAVAAVMEANYPGLAAKTRAEKKAEFEARQAARNQQSAAKIQKSWWQFW